MHMTCLENVGLLHTTEFPGFLLSTFPRIQKNPKFSQHFYKKIPPCLSMAVFPTPANLHFKKIEVPGIPILTLPSRYKSREFPYSRCPEDINPGNSHTHVAQ